MAKTITAAEVLALPMDPGKNDAEASTIREYLTTLFNTLIRQRSEFNGKRPFGNSGWEFDIYRAMVEADVIDGEIDTDDTLKDCNEDHGFELLRSAAQKLLDISEFVAECDADAELVRDKMKSALEATLSWMTNVNVNDPATLGRQIMAALESSGVPKEDLDSAAVALVRGPCAVPNLMGEDRSELLDAAEDDFATAAGMVDLLEEVTNELDASGSLASALITKAKDVVAAYRLAVPEQEEDGGC